MARFPLPHVSRMVPALRALRRRARRFASAALLLGAAALVAGAALFRWAGEEPSRTGSGKEPSCEISPVRPMAGVSLVAPRRPGGGERVAALERVAAEWVAVLPYAFIGEDDRVLYDRERQWWGERPEGVAATIRHAREHGLRVMLKPHLWAGRSGWVGTYSPDSEEGWRRFGESYARYVLALARLAEDLEVELFVVGTELDETIRRRPELWTDLIDRVREVYRGPVTYAANWDGYLDVPFWDRLEYIGVNAYFPLSTAETPTVDELLGAWRPHVASLAALCRRHERPILFPEYGYRSIDGAAGAQWDMPPERSASTPVNLEAQVAAYEAFFRTWWDRPWFAGGFLWKWFPEERSPDAFPRRETPLADYTPEGKPVEDVIREWHRKE